MSNKWGGEEDETKQYKDVENDYIINEEKWCLILDELELLNKIKLENIVPDTSSDNLNVNKIKALIEKHGIIFKKNSNIIYTNYSINHTNNEMNSEPRQEEITSLKSREFIILWPERGTQSVTPSQDSRTGVILNHPNSNWPSTSIISRQDKGWVTPWTISPPQ